MFDRIFNIEMPVRLKTPYSDKKPARSYVARITVNRKDFLIGYARCINPFHVHDDIRYFQPIVPV